MHSSGLGVSFYKSSQHYRRLSFLARIFQESLLMEMLLCGWVLKFFKSGHCSQTFFTQDFNWCLKYLIYCKRYSRRMWTDIRLCHDAVKSCTSHFFWTPPEQWISSELYLYSHVGDYSVAFVPRERFLQRFHHSFKMDNFSEKQAGNPLHVDDLHLVSGAVVPQYLLPGFVIHVDVSIFATLCSNQWQGCFSGVTSDISSLHTKSFLNKTSKGLQDTSRIEDNCLDLTVCSSVCFSKQNLHPPCPLANNVSCLYVNVITTYLRTCPFSEFKHFYFSALVHQNRLFVLRNFNFLVNCIV